MSDHEEEQAEPVAEEQTPEDEERIAQTAPVMPWEIVLNSCGVFYQRAPGGRMTMKFCPAMPTPMGVAPIPPGISITFEEAEWERFKDEVASDGERKPTIQTATILPGTRLL